ncbi:MAG TPA: threonine synthase [Candidatus Limnocylindrales bacterium]|nr:threonine synthase [Candidatus Limnocylindrales bacterium]
MTTLLDTPAPNALGTDRILGLRCRGCGALQPLGLAYVCSRCFGPLEVAYDLDAIGPILSPTVVAARPAGIWRYAELLPVEPPARSLAVGSSPLVSADRLGPALGVDRLWLKDDTRNPTLSFKDRAVAIATATATALGLPVLACASTGNLAGATAAAAAAAGLRALVVIPADLEPAKVEHALAYGASVLPVEGTYDDVNRLCLELADETGWGFVNVNLRPFYAEGSKTLAFEVAEQLGWRTPDVIVSPIASGALFTKLAEGFEQLAAVGLIERRPVRFVGAQAAGCAPVATAWAEGAEVVRPVRAPDTIVRSLAIGSPADGAYAVELARSSGGSVESIPDEATAAAVRQTAELEGIYGETAVGVTVASVEAARRRGVIRDGDEVVALLTGNGLKTPDARWLGLDRGRVAPGERGLAAPVRPVADDVLDALQVALAG